MTRRTKVVATLGPATDEPAVLERMITAGCDVVRINFSHGDAETHARRIRMVRAAARELDTEDRKSTRLNSSHVAISYAVFCLKKKINKYIIMADNIN